MRRTFLLNQMRLRASTSTLSSPFSYFSRCICCGAAAPFPFSSLSTHAIFYGEHCLFFALFFAKRKAEMLKAEEEGKEDKEWVGKCADRSYFSSEQNVLLLKGGGGV